MGEGGEETRGDGEERRREKGKKYGTRNRIKRKRGWTGIGKETSRRGRERRETRGKRRKSEC